VSKEDYVRDYDRQAMQRASDAPERNRHVAPRTATGRDLLRSRALQAGYDAIVGLDPEPTLSYYDFVEGVKVYEAKLAEQHLERQYEYEQRRGAIHCSDCGGVVADDHHACGRGDGHILKAEGK